MAAKSSKMSPRALSAASAATKLYAKFARLPRSCQATKEGSPNGEARNDLLGDNSDVCTRTAMADPAAVVKAHSDAFGKAFNSCDVPAALKLYEDNAVLIWPGEGEVANGKAAIARVINTEC